MKKIKLLSLFLTLIILISGCSKFSTNYSTESAIDPAPITNTNNINLGSTTISVIDVGQGLSVLITNNNEAMLFDCGPTSDSQNIVEYLNNNNITSLKYVILSHPHEDHIGGFCTINDNFSIENIIMPDVTSTTKTFENVITSIEKKNQEITIAKPNDTYTLGNSSFTIFSPDSTKYNDLNDYSIGIKYDDQIVNLIIDGDATTIAESNILASNFNLHEDNMTNVLIVPHHGSKYSLSKEFLEAINPDYAIISVGLDNSYGHPNKETMNKLQNENITIYQTSINGTILINTTNELVNITPAK